MRLEGKTAIVIGAGQGPGEGMGNGRATALRFAQEGAKLMAVDRDLGSVEPGKLADLAIVEGNPLQDINATRRVRYTIANGRLYALDELLGKKSR